MAWVDGVVCVDRYEATLEEWVDGAWQPASPYVGVAGRTVRAAVAPGQIPQGYVSGDEAAAACAAAGKRLCTSDAWLAACRGPADWTYPYGDAYQSGACNDDYAGDHPVIDFFGSTDVWDAAHLNDPGINQQPGTVAPGGAFAGCVSAWGVFDLHGNLHEWVDDADGTFRGGFYADAAVNGPGCSYVTTAHVRSYADYSTGFRCCADPR
jgi:sulfatase modifying factor 1